MSKSNVNPFEKYFGNIDEEFNLLNKRLKELIKHPTALGTENESILREFLKNHIPGHYSIGHGFVFKNEDEISKQCDVIIYDSNFFPPIFKRGDFVIVLPESVMTVIEVKEKLSKGKNLTLAIDNIKSVRKLNDRISGLIFAYTGSTPVSILNAITNYNKNNKIDLRNIFDLMLILDKEYCIFPKHVNTDTPLFSIDGKNTGYADQFVLCTDVTEAKSIYLLFYYIMRQIRTYVLNAFIKFQSHFKSEFEFVPLTIPGGLSNKGYFDEHKNKIVKLIGDIKHNDKDEFIGISMENSGARIPETQC